MVANHSWARKTHDFADFLPFVRFVAMDAAGRAKCLRLHERTSFHPLANIICKAFAVSAKIFGIFERETVFVLSFAVKLNHKKHRPPFILSFLFCRHRLSTFHFDFSNSFNLCEKINVFYNHENHNRNPPDSCSCGVLVAHPKERKSEHESCRQKNAEFCL